MKTPAVVLVLLLLHAVAEGHPGKGKKFFMAYANHKVLEQCYGPDMVQEWKVWMEAHWETCQENAGAHRTRRHADSEEITSSEEVESLLLPPEEIKKMKAKKMQKINILTCLMDQMNVTMTPEGAVDAAPHVAYFNSLGLDATLLDYAVKGFQKCARRKMRRGGCEDDDSSGEVVMKDPTFLPRLKFLRCATRARLRACFMHDLKNKKMDLIKSYGFENLMNFRVDEDDLIDIDVDDDDDDDK